MTFRLFSRDSKFLLLSYGKKIYMVRWINIDFAFIVKEKKKGTILTLYKILLSLFVGVGHGERKFERD